MFSPVDVYCDVALFRDEESDMVGILKGDLVPARDDMSERYSRTADPQGVNSNTRLTCRDIRQARV